jgi:hypothetical protein
MEMKNPDEVLAAFWPLIRGLTTALSGQLMLQDGINWSFSDQNLFVIFRVK